jgi:hypothetical protein
MNPTSDTNNESTILKLESLIQQYNLLLTEYQQVNQNYLSSLSASKNWIIINDHAVWGSNQLSAGPVTDASACFNICKANPSCTSATFEPTSNNYCWTSSGDNGTLGTTPGQIAMIPESMQYKMKLKNLNMQLQSIISAIDKYSKEVPLPLSGSQVSSQMLEKNYEQLMNDRQIIDQALSENESLTEEIKETSLSVTHYYYIYFFLFLLFLFLLYLLFGHLLVSSGSSSSSSSGSIFGGTTSKHNLGI